jgi:hypothetical protein
VTAEASVALKDWPVVLIFDPTDSPSLTVRVVPAGTTTGCGSGAAAGVAAGAAELIAFPPAAFDGAAMFWPAELEAVSAGLLEQATSVNNRATDNRYNARERMIFPSNIKFVEAKTVIEGGHNVQTRRSGGTLRHDLCSTLSVR